MTITMCPASSTGIRYVPTRTDTKRQRCGSQLELSAALCKEREITRFGVSVSHTKLTPKIMILFNLHGHFMQIAANVFL